MPHCKDIICNIYRPPNGKLDKTIKYLEHCLASINCNKTDIFLMGDLNVDYSSKKTTDYKSLSFFIKSNQFLQLINEHTRITKKTKTTLDLIITNCKYTHKAGSLDTFISDHRPTHVTKRNKGIAGLKKPSLLGRIEILIRRNLKTSCPIKTGIAS